MQPEVARVSRRFRTLNALAISAAVLGYAMFFWLTRRLWLVIPGKQIRPMNLTSNLVLLALATLLVELTISAFAGKTDFRDRRIRACSICLGAAFGMFLFIPLYYWSVAWIKGFTID
jgi:hypothetical protein